MKIFDTMGNNTRDKFYEQGVENVVNLYEKCFNFCSKYVEKQWDSSATKSELLIITAKSKDIRLLVL